MTTALAPPQLSTDPISHNAFDAWNERLEAFWWCLMHDDLRVPRFESDPTPPLARTILLDGRFLNRARLVLGIAEVAAHICGVSVGFARKALEEKVSAHHFQVSEKQRIARSAEREREEMYRAALSVDLRLDQERFLDFGDRVYASRDHDRALKIVRKCEEKMHRENIVQKIGELKSLIGHALARGFFWMTFGVVAAGLGECLALILF